MILKDQVDMVIILKSLYFFFIKKKKKIPKKKDTYVQLILLCSSNILHWDVKMLKNLSFSFFICVWVCSINSWAEDYIG